MTKAPKLLRGGRAEKKGGAVESVCSKYPIAQLNPPDKNNWIDFESIPVPSSAGKRRCKYPHYP